jgi:hypothetical protein
MAGPAHPLSLLLLAALLGPASRAQTASPPIPAVAEPAASAKLAKLFAGTPPKFDPPKPATATPASVTTDQPRNGIVRLPTYLVRGDTRVPDEYQILTPKGRDAAMAQRYLGPQNRLDAALNGVTLTGLWKSIPLLGKVPFVPFASMTYNERAAFLYERPELKRRVTELMSIEQAARELEKPKPAPADPAAK